jgi:ubiquitin-conjugating enzyme E2 G1
MSLLGDPNFESPANIDASVMLKNDAKAYKKKIKDLVRRSQDAL